MNPSHLSHLSLADPQQLCLDWLVTDETDEGGRSEGHLLDILQWDQDSFLKSS